MKISSFGEENNRMIVILHSNSLNGWNESPVIKKCSRNYHIVIISLCHDEDVHKAERYLKVHGGKIFALFSFCSEWKNHVLLMQNKDLDCQKSVIESDSVCPGKTVEAFLDELDTDKKVGIVL